MRTNLLRDLPPDNGLDFRTKPQPPLIKRNHSIPVSIKRFYTDVDGVIVAKNLVPAALQVQFPFFVLGEFDRLGGYATGLKVCPPTPGTYYLMSFVEGAGITCQQITGFTGLNNIRNQIKTGDIVTVYVDDLTAPTYFIWLIQTSRNGSIASMVGNSETTQNDQKLGPLFVDHFQYFTSNPATQWEVPLYFTRSSNITSWNNDMVMPSIFKTPYTEQDGFVRVKCFWNLNQFQSVSTYMLYATDEIQMNFQIKY